MQARKKENKIQFSEDRNKFTNIFHEARVYLFIFFYKLCINVFKLGSVDTWIPRITIIFFSAIFVAVS